jgi:ribose transport system permease protein
MAILAVFIRKTRTGRYTCAIGGSENAALLSGVNVKRVKVAAYMAAGALSAVAGLLVTARLHSAQPGAGSGYELDSIAAAATGVTPLRCSE